MSVSLLGVLDEASYAFSDSVASLLRSLPVASCLLCSVPPPLTCLLLCSLLLCSSLLSSSLLFSPLLCSARRVLSSQPIVSLDWSPDKEGLCVLSCLDQTLRVFIVTKLNKY